MSTPSTALEGLEAALQAAGGSAALIRKLGRKSKSAVGNWRRRDGGIPAGVVPEVSRITGLPPHVLRPDLFDAPSTKPALEGVAA